MDDDIPVELGDEYRLIANVAQEMIEGFRENTMERVDVARSASPFMKIASLIKDKFFRDEKEARVVAMRLKRGGGEDASHEVHVRHIRGNAVPYIKLFEKRLFGKHSPIEAIIIGPHPDRERRREALSMVLEAKGLTQIAVVQSEVPYLGG